MFFNLRQSLVKVGIGAMLTVLRLPVLLEDFTWASFSDDVSINVAVRSAVGRDRGAFGQYPARAINEPLDIELLEA